MPFPDGNTYIMYHTSVFLKLLIMTSCPMYVVSQLNKVKKGKNTDTLTVLSKWLFLCFFLTSEEKGFTHTPQD